MRAVLQRTAWARVKVDDQAVGKIDKGIVMLLGINSGDGQKEFDYILDKSINLRIFEDENGKMNLSLKDIEGGLLIVPNFTIYADARKGRRPSFAMGAKPEEAEEIFNAFVGYAKSRFLKTESGIFRADMKVELLNDGPITILIDSDRLF